MIFCRKSFPFPEAGMKEVTCKRGTDMLWRRWSKSGWVEGMVNMENLHSKHSLSWVQALLSCFYLIHILISWQWWWWFICQVMSDSWSHMVYNLPGSSVHGISQARILEWLAFSFTRGSFKLRDLTPDLLHCRQILYRLSYQGSIPTVNPINQISKSSPWMPCLLRWLNSTVMCIFLEARNF